MDDPKPAAPQRRIIDISTPGSTPPAPSSRPVIVGHKPSVSDPMVSTHEHAPHIPPGDLAKNTTYPNRHNKSIEPHPMASPPEKPTEPPKPQPTSVPIQIASKPSTPPPPPVPPPEKPAPKPVEHTPLPPAEPASKPEPAPTPPPPETPTQKPANEPAANQSPDQIKQMVSDKTYFAPIASTKSWTWIMIAAIALAIIGIAGAIYLVMA